MKRVTLIVALLSTAACGVPYASPVMQPGVNCMLCHSGRRRNVWTAAGTVFKSSQSTTDQGVEHVQVLITDGSGRQLTLVSNSAGNFYTAETLQMPISVQLQQGTTRIAMQKPVTTGACNSCHTLPPQLGAPGRVYMP